MMYLRYALYAPLSLFFNIFVILTSPFWAGLVAVTRAAHLPYPLSMLYTDDDDIYGSGMTKDPVPPTVWKRFTRAMWWLCRNPGFGFAKDLLGRPTQATIMMIDRTSPQVWDSGEYCIEHFVAITADGRRWFNYRRDIPLPMSKYCKIWFGWQDDGRLKIMFNPFLTSRGNQ
jgi:hypothetical protein